ncbi:ataxin-2-like protein [Galendromus occidentalis]|uniref:Ataxin-2-like protein n=1 Tax=Galendromus occidentalis TaxID=34638 RepID=A0AAJ7PAQ7_9ACAR|nr:ataxin-2-like protein [Galendromus occidentalis]
MNSQADKKQRNVKSNGAAANNKAVGRNQNKAPAEKPSVAQTSRENREHPDGKVVTPMNATGVYGNARFVHAIAALVGHVVQVRLRGDKDVYEGVLFTISPTFDVALNTVHVLESDGSDAHAEAPQAPGHLSGLLRNMGRLRKQPSQPLQETMIFNISNIVSMTALNIDLGFVTKENAFTDSQISRSNGRITERDLQVWEDDGTESTKYGQLEDISGTSAGWAPADMFATNLERFGVKTSFKDDLTGYTTPIPTRDDAEYRAKEALAAKIASEIESNPQHKRNYELENGGDEDDEEIKYSAVVMSEDRNRTQQQSQQHSQQQLQQQQERSESRYAHNHRRKQMAPVNGAVKGSQRGTTGGHHSQRNNHNRSPPMSSPSPQQQGSPHPQQQQGQMQPQQREAPSRKEQHAPTPPQQVSGTRAASPAQQHAQAAGSQSLPPPPASSQQQQQQHHHQSDSKKVAPNEKHAATRKSPSPKLDATQNVPKKEAPIQVHEIKKSPPASPPGEAKSKASPTPERGVSPRTLEAPSPAPSASGQQANTEEIVKKSTLNPNAKDFVPTPKPQTMSHKHGVPQGHMNPAAVAGHGGPRGGHISIGGPAQGGPHAQSGGVIMAPFPFPGSAGPHQHQHQHQAGGHNRSYRGNKGQNRQAMDQTMHVTGPPMVQGPQQQQLIVGYPPPNAYGPAHPQGVASNVVTMQPPLGHVPAQQVQMVNYSLVPTRGVISPPGAPAGVFPSMQLYSDGGIHLAPQPQMIFRELTANAMYPSQIDANLFVVSPPAQTPSQSGAPTPPSSSGPHGHPSQPPMSYSSQPPWPAQPLLMMSANGGPAGTPPPHHLIMAPAPPPMGPAHAAGHGPAHGHGHGHFAQAIAVQNGPGALQVQTNPVVTGPSTNSNVTPGQAPPQAQSQATPTGQAPTSGVVVPPPPNQSGQQTGPQQPPSQQTQQTPGRANRT